MAELRTSRKKECAKLDAWANTTIARLQCPGQTILRAAIREEALAAKKSLQEAFSAAIKRCTDQRLTLDNWNAAGRPAYAAVSAPALLVPARLDNAEQERVPEGQFQTRGDRWATTYFDRGVPVFTDHRVIILVHRDDHIAAIDEALRLGAARWGSLSIQGSDAFLQLAATRAIALNIVLVQATGVSFPSEGRTKTAKESAPQSVPGHKGTRSPVDDDEKIDRFITRFKDDPALPLRRREMPGDTAETGRTGALEVVLGEGLRKTAQLDAIFSADQRFQAFLEECRTIMLNRLHFAMSDVGVERYPTSSAELLEVIKPDETLMRAAILMFGDRDCQEMLRRERERLFRRAQNRNATSRSNRNKGSVTSAPKEDGTVETGNSIAEVQWFLDRQGKSR